MKEMIVDSFDLKHTLTSGQFFRYRELGDHYVVQTQDKVFAIAQRSNLLIFEGVNDNFLKKFFALEEDYGAVKKHLSKHPPIAKALQQFHGLRIIKQDPWECLASFILSSASNIPRITKNVEQISQTYGKKIKVAGNTYYRFPEPNLMKDIGQNSELKLGFRAKYMQQLSTLKPIFFKRIESMNYEDAKKELMQLPGVAEKIADCVLLFGYGFQESFPVDVHIKKAMCKHYLPEKTPLKKIAEFGRKKFAPYAGYAQQYLYHAQRCNKH